LKKQYLVEYAIVIFLGILILNWMIYYYNIALGNNQRMEIKYFPSIMYSLLAVLFGVLIEWKRLKTIFTGNLSVNWLFFLRLY